MRHLLGLTALLLVVFARPLLAADAPATPLPSPTSNPMDKVLPEVNFNGVTLEEVIDFLQAASPGFKATVFRDADVPEDYPQIKLKLKNVTVGDFWMLLQMAYPHIIESQPVRDDGGPSILFMTRIHNPAADEPRAAAVGGVKVYRLAAILNAMAVRNGKEKPAPAKKDALNQVLSLVKAAMAQVPGKTDAVLQVHEETDTLVFKGNAEQRAALQEVLDALDPNMSPIDPLLAEANRQRDMTAQLRDKVAERAAKLEAELADVRQRLADEQKVALDRALEVEKLKVRLEESQTIDKEKAIHQIEAAQRAADQQQLDLKQQFQRLAVELDDARKLRAEAEQESLVRARETEKLKIRLEEALRLAEKATRQSAPGSAPAKE